jgi:general secretion pathway protein G
MFKKSATRERGFSIIEVTIVLMVIVIIIAIVVPGYQRVLLASKEETLRRDLVVMREMIDQYSHDKEAAPQTLEDLVIAEYLPKLPEDPMTGSADTWQVILEDDPLSVKGERGIVDVKSGSDEVDSSGEKRYSDW